MFFEITKALEAKLVSLTNRSEHHGEDDVPAISMWFEAETDNTILDGLGDGRLRFGMYEADEKQTDVPGVPKLTTPNLRTESVERVNIAQKALEGWTLKVDHGIDEEDPVTFGACKVDGFQFTPKARATVILKWRVGTSDISAESLGIIGMKVGQSVKLMLIAPKDQPAKTTDKGAPLFEGDKAAEPRKPAAAERAAVAKVKGGKAEAPTGKETATPEKALAESVAPLPSTTRNPAQSRTARGREKTKAALAAGATS